MAGYEGVAILQRPGLEDLAGYALLERLHGREIPVRFIWRHPQCSPAQLKAWDDSKIFALGLGEERLEMEERGGLLIEYVANQFAVDFTPGEQELFKTMRRHNQTSFLNRTHGSVHRLARWMYDLVPVSEWPMVISQMLEVIHVWVRVKDGEVKQTWRDEKHFLSWFPRDLPIDLSRKSAFSISQYIRDRVTVGDSPAEALKRANWWIQAHVQVRDRMRSAEEQFRQMDVPGDRAGDVAVLALYTGDRFLSRAVMASGFCDVFVAIRKETNHTSILTNGWDVSALARALQEFEGWKWYHHARTGQVINGGFRNDETPGTRLSYAGVLDFIRENPPVPPPDPNKGEGEREERE